MAFIKHCYRPIGPFPIVAFLNAIIDHYIFLKKKLAIAVFQNTTIDNKSLKKKKIMKHKNKCFQTLKIKITILIKLRNTTHN